MHRPFTDFKAAYDGIIRTQRHLAMNINNRLANLVKTTMKDTKCQIRIQGMLSEPSSIRNGVCESVFIHLPVAGDASRNMTGNIFYRYGICR